LFFEYYIMNYKKNFCTIIFFIFIFQSVSICANVSKDKYDEFFVLRLNSFNFLENIQKYSSHKFILNVSTDLNSNYHCFLIENRNMINIGTISYHEINCRNITFVFDVYEIYNENLYRCDLSKKQGVNSASIIYDSFTGHWSGDDELGDISGYGRLNGCDDGSFNDFERDVELCFSIKVVDFDGDSIPQWYEEHVYGTDFMVNNSEDDHDFDEIPLSWEYKWGYDPFSYDDHKTLDDDEDGLCNFEEFLVSSWNSDPFRDDLFLELDQMQIGPNGEGSFIPTQSIIMVAETFAKRNIMFHVDDGYMGGGEILPFEPFLFMGEGRDYYYKYFLNNDSNSWKRGVFRYALFVYNHLPIRGMEFPGEHTILLYFLPGLNSFVLSTSIFEMVDRSIINASAFMILHELGHTCGIYMGKPFGCDNQLMRFPWSLQRLLFHNYKSVMNYKYAYSILDYSDGSHGLGDYNDWEHLDLTFFQPYGAL